MPVIQDVTQLKEYMFNALGKLAGMFGYTNSGFDDEVNQVLLFFGVTEPSAVENQLQLMAVARYFAIKRAWIDSTALYDFQADNAQYNRSQVSRQLKNLLDAAESDVINSGAIVQEIIITNVQYLD